MAATKRFMNWTTVTWNSVTITGVTTCSFGKGGQLIKFAGDGDIVPSLIVLASLEPHASVTSADVYALNNTCTTGVGATLVATLADAKNATGGNLTFTMTNAVVENVDSSAQHAQFGTATVNFQSYSSDGATNPLTFAEA